MSRKDLLRMAVMVVAVLGSVVFFVQVREELTPHGRIATVALCTAAVSALSLPLWGWKGIWRLMAATLSAGLFLSMLFGAVRGSWQLFHENTGTGPLAMATLTNDGYSDVAEVMPGCRMAKNPTTVSFTIEPTGNTCRARVYGKVNLEVYSTGDVTGVFVNGVNAIDLTLAAAGSSNIYVFDPHAGRTFGAPTQTLGVAPHRFYWQN